MVVIENDEADQEILLRAFGEFRHDLKIDVIEDGAAGIKLIESLAGEISLVILDLQLDGISGFEVLKKLRQNPLTSTIPIIILSTSNANEDIVKSYAFGANSYIVKPTSFAEFVKIAKNINEYWMHTSSYVAS